MNRNAIACLSAIALLVGVAAGPASVAAQEKEVPMYGAGPDRLCNPVVDNRRGPVMTRGGDVVRQKGTYDCPEPEEVEPAAAPPAAPLPEELVLYFGFDKAELSAEEKAKLEAAIAEAKEAEFTQVVVAGYTDTAGPDSYNMLLSQRRANAVAADLIKAGIAADQVDTVAFGQDKLAVPTPDEVPKKENRRVVVKFLR